MDIYKLVLKDMVKNNITKALNSLGIEGTLEAIERISSPYIRSRLREEFLSRLIKGGR